MPAVRTLPQARQPRVVPYEQVVDLDINPAPPPPIRPESMAHIVSQTQQPPQPPLPYSHPSYQHYPPPFYPYPPPPSHHQPPYPHPHPQYPYQPSPYAHHPPTGHHPPAPPAPPPPPNSTANPPSQAAGPPQRLRWVHPTAGAGNPPQAAHQDGETPTATFARDRNTEDDDTKLVRCALRWNFVRVPGVSHTLFWNDLGRSFERIRGRPYGSCKKRMDTLERTWRDIFASRDAPGGLRGNNNTDMARAMRAWIAFRDDEERQKKEKEDDANALDIRRRRLHELETERLGLTEVCRYDTRVITEDEEIGSQGIGTNERQAADGDGSNPILVDDEPTDQTVLDPLEDLEPPKSNEQSNAADQTAPIVELLRKWQREEREEADIRREEQVLLNKRLALMEEQVQMLSKLITQHNPPPISPSPRGYMDANARTATAAGPESRSETAATSQGHNIIQIDDAPAEDALEEPTNAPLEPGNKAAPTDTDTDTRIANEVAETLGPEDADVGERTLNEAADVPGDASMGDSAEVVGPEDADVDKRTLNEAADGPGDASMGDSAEMPSASSAGLETRMTISATSSQNGFAQTMSKSAPSSPATNTHEAMDENEAMESPRTTETIDD